LVPVVWPSLDLLTWLDRRLVRVLGHVIVAEGIPLPDDGYDPRRRQYLGEPIRHALRALPYPAAKRVLGLAEADCYAPFALWARREPAPAAAAPTRARSVSTSSATPGTQDPVGSLLCDALSKRAA